MIIPNKQPEAPLISAFLEFDADINELVLIEEKQKRLRNGSSIMYDTTARSISFCVNCDSDFRICDICKK